MSEALRAQLTVSRARSAARAGDLDRAARLLDDLDGADADATVLDLRARLHAQRGELAEADRCWAAVQEIAPDDAAAAAGRRTIERIIAGRRRVRPLLQPGLLGAATAVVAVAALVAGVVVVQSGEPGQPAMAARAEPAQIGSDAPAQRLKALEADRAAAARREQAAESRRAEQAARRERQVAAIASRLAMPGVKVEPRRGHARVIFKSGLFPYSAEISETGAALLRKLGRRLARLDTTTTVVGHVVAVPGGRTEGGSVVALGRALVAARHLAEGGELALTSFTLVSADQSEGPFADAPRNRTVTLLVEPEDSP
ncbi:hypothetical protein E1286_06300 [Nonomuraea terrae]|uniref:Tetratricopeptide repeat protein n=1 Tax=Nonomuraea terrae TaxID=2530383 RepID=A0A4R4Z7E3_9ACTN|nr:hypothetical protein [Nonomuraea terrae]TDD54108.1 hypothetical protein E1286_06300 [Nonomuraea terrae]